MTIHLWMSFIFSSLILFDIIARRQKGVHHLYLTPKSIKKRLFSYFIEFQAVIVSIKQFFYKRIVFH